MGYSYRGRKQLDMTNTFTSYSVQGLGHGHLCEGLILPIISLKTFYVFLCLFSNMTSVLLSKLLKVFQIHSKFL